MHRSVRLPFLRTAAVSLLTLTAVAAQTARPSAQAAGQRWDGLIEDITVSQGYFPPMPPPANGPSQLPRHAVSADGRYVLFTSQATNLAGFYSGHAVYLRDRHTFETRLLLAGAALDPVLSADGNHVAFQVCDPYAHMEGPREICDVYAIDLGTWMWTNLSAAADGTLADADSGQPVLSSDGRFVVFRTKSSNIAPGLGTAGEYQIVIRDRDADGNGVFDEPGTALLETVSVSEAGIAGGAASESAEVSDDGRFVAFRSLASNLVPADTNNAWDLFLRDRSADQTRRINVRPEGQQSPVAVSSPAISMTPDGSLIAFSSADGMLAPSTHDDTNNVSDVFVYTVATGAITRVDLGWGPPVAGGYIPGNGATEWPMFSADGRYLTVQSAATNVETPGVAGLSQVYVVDRATGMVHRISINPDGTHPNQDTVHPQISADGSMVVFASAATNLRSDVQDDYTRVYAAVYFDVTPPQVTVGGGGGGLGAFTVTAQQHTNWWAMWDWSTYWFSIETPPMGVGSGSFSFRATTYNPDPVSRSAAIHVMSKTVHFGQSEGLVLNSLSPSAGPETGGTRVTLTGVGFEPGLQVVFDGWTAETEFVDSTTMIAVAPPHAVGRVWVAIFSMTDGRAGWIPDAFRYLDTTPPDFVFPYFFGTQGNDGWYKSDVTVNWAVWDDQTPIITTSGCESTVVTTDTNGRTFTCSATSEGGTRAASTVVKRDTTPPTMTIARPAARALYEPTEPLTSELSCSDSGSGVADCGLGTPSGTPIDLSYSGWHTMWLGAMDVAGNAGASSVEYAVATGYCMPAMPGLRLWFDFNGDIRDKVHGYPSAQQNPSWSSLTYVPGEVGSAVSLPGWQSIRFTHQLDDVHFVGTMTVAAWIKPDGQSGEAGTIVSKEDQFRIARFPDGTVRFAFANANPGLLWTNTNVVLPAGMWTHLVVTFEHGVVKTYVNGALMHTYNGAGDMEPISGLPYWGSYMSIGNREDPAQPSFLVGAIDEVQLFETVWYPPMPESMFLSGASGTCALTPTVVLVSNPETTYGATTVEMVAQLRVGATQAPIANRPLRVVSRLSGNGSIVGTATVTTDEAGYVRWFAPIAPDAPPNNYVRGIEVFFDADFEYGGSMGIGQVSIRGGIPSINWPTPAPIVYGTGLGSAQLNAAANVPGLFFYSQMLGTVLPAGQQILSVTFRPNSNYYNDATASTTLTVVPATPAVTVTGGLFTYDGAAHGATGTALGVNGVVLSPVVIRYNGSTTAPSAAGTYDVTAEYAGSANYTPATASTTLTIAKAAPSITWASPASIAYGTPLSGANLNATANIPGSFSYAPAAGTVLHAGTETLTVTFTPADGANYTTATATRNIAVTRATPTVTVNGGAFTYDGNPHAATGSVVGAGGASLGSLAFTYNGLSAEPVDAGSYAVVGSFAGSSDYSAASATGVVVINKALATFAVTGGTFVYDKQPHPASATATGVLGEPLSPIQLLYDGTSSSAPIDAGAHTVRASFGGSANYAATQSAAVAITINKAVPVVEIGTNLVFYTASPHDATVTVRGIGGDELYPYVVLYDGSSTRPSQAGSYAIHVQYGGSANYEAASGDGTFVINKTTPIMSMGVDNATYDGQPHGAGAGVVGYTNEWLTPVVITYNGSTTVPVNAGVYTVEARYDGSANYTSISRTMTLTIFQAVPYLRWFPGPGSITYGTPLGAAQFGATADVPGGFAYTPAAGAVLGVGSHQLTAAFTPADPLNYTTGSISATLSISKASPAISIQGGSFTFDGSAHAATGSVTGVGGAALGPLTFTYNGGSSAPINAGTYTVIGSFPGDENYSAASSSATITIAKASPVLSWPRPAAMYYGAPLGLGQLSATVNVPGAFSYSPSFGAVLPAGAERVLAVTFTPADAANYNAASASTTIDVLPVPLTVRAADAVKAFGAPLPLFTATFFGFVNGETTASLNGSLAFATTANAASPVGSYPIVPSGVGSPNYTVTFVGGTLSIIPAATAVSVTSSPSPSGLNQPMTFTAAVAPVAPGAGAPTGSVQFFEGTVLLGTTPLASGAATLTTAGLPSGSHQIEARYSGDGSFFATNGFATHVVNAVSGTPTVTISSSANPVAAGASVTFTAMVSMGSGSAPGVVAFYDGGTAIGSATLSAGRATFSTASLVAGTHALTARYEGSATAPPSRSVVLAQAVLGPGWKSKTSTTSIISSPNASALGAPVDFTVTVTGSGGVPTGRVLFMVDGVVVGNPAGEPLSSGSSAHATLQLTTLNHGRHDVTATYLGDSNFKGSTAAVAQVVN